MNPEIHHSLFLFWRRDTGKRTLSKRMGDIPDKVGRCREEVLLGSRDHATEFDISLDEFLRPMQE
jgi:hypothetical protein